MNNLKFKVWSCKIVIPDVEIPDGFDFPPRFGAISAIEENNIKVLACFSGWAGTLTEGEREVVEHHVGQKL